MYQRIPKIFSVILVLFIILNTFSFLFLNLAWTSSSAAEPKFKIPDLQIKIPGLDSLSQPMPCKDDPSKMCVNWIGEYIAGIYKYAIGVVGIIATVVMMIGGVMWIVAGGNATRIGEAKAWVGASLTGLVLALSSYVILYQINPSLTQFKPIEVSVATDSCGGCGENQECAEINSSKIIDIRGINNYVCLNTSPGECTYVLISTRKDNGHITKFPHIKRTASEKECINDIINTFKILTKENPNVRLSLFKNTYDYTVLTGPSGCCLFDDGTCENTTQDKCTSPHFTAHSHCGPISSCEPD